MKTFRKWLGLLLVVPGLLLILLGMLIATGLKRTVSRLEAMAEALGFED